MSKHGHARRGAKSPEYRTWVRIRRRCYETGHQDFPQYGGRGVTVVPEWQDFSVFLADMGERPSSAHSLDRIDCEGDYSKENCRWATQTEQQNNRRNNRRLTFKGKTQTMTEWSRELGVTYHMIQSRLNRGWSVERTLTTPSLR